MRVIIDANNIAKRARHGGLVLRARSDGRRTATIFGFLRILATSLRTLKACGYHTTLVWDGGHSAYRKALYPDYKKRVRTPAEMLEDVIYNEQVKVLREEFIPALGIPSGSIPGIEADDIISSVAIGSAPATRPCVIVSGDSDFHQIVSDGVIHQLNSDGDIIHEAQVLAKWGTKGHGIALAKSIIGDTSDKIKGVPGIGVKRAAALVPYYDLILEHVRKRANGTADANWSLPAEYAEKHAKVHAFLLAGFEVLERNLKMITLPDFFDDDHFPDTEARVKFCHEVLRDGGKPLDTYRFSALCREWELDDLIPEVLKVV